MASVAVVDTLNSWLVGVRQALNERHWSGTVANISEDLVDWPVITSSFVQKKYSVSAPTAKSAMDRLLEIGVLQELTGRTYGRVYGAVDVIKAVEAL
jgi:hypothetical protein